MSVEQFLQQNVYSNPVNYPHALNALSPNASVHSNFFQHYFGTSLVGIIVFAALVLLFVLSVAVVLELLNYRQLVRLKSVCLEIIPPAFDDKEPVATEELFAVIHGLGSSSSWLRRHPVLSLEVMSTSDSGIRFMVVAPETMTKVLRHQLQAYLPDIVIKEAPDYLPAALDKRRVKLADFKLSRPNAYPLNAQRSLSRHDPIAYLTNAMSDLEVGELVTWQIVLSPASSWTASRLHRRTMSGKSSRWRTHYARLHAQPSLMDKVNSKLALPLFNASLRALVVSDSPEHQAEIAKGLKSALAAFAVPGVQSLAARPGYLGLLNSFRLWQFQQRLLSFQPGYSLLSSRELAGLYHFPHSTSSRTDNLVKSLSRTLPAPLSMKSAADFDVVLGQNVHHGRTTPIGLSAAERQRHVYIVGGTGNGKTTMLLNSIVQDMVSGQGLAVVDPHGDLAETLLRYVPRSRVGDVIYFNPDDIRHPLGLNLLELPEGLSEAELVREKDLITETVVSVFRKIFSDDDSGGHRIEYVLRNAVQTALTLEGSTIFTVFRLLTDGPYRKSVARSLDNQDLKHFWANELGKAGEFQRVKMSAGVTSKIGRFLFSASARRIMDQPHSTIDFDNILASGQILICNFSKGLLGEDTSSLFGITVLAKLQLATLRRARLESSLRPPFYLYADEFQNFATISFVQMLSEARKYQLFLTMAEQSTAQQQEQRLVNIILANVGTVVCFRTGSPVDEQLLLPLFKPFVNEGEIAYLPAFSFYMRLGALQPVAPLSGETLLLDNEGSKTIAKNVIETSRKQYTIANNVPSKKGDGLAQSRFVINTKLQQKRTSSMKMRLGRQPNNFT